MFSTLSAYRTLTAVALLLASSIPALATEKVWDNELRRFLKDDDFKYEEFMSEEEAVKTILPKSQRVRKELIRLTAISISICCSTTGICAGWWRWS